MEGTSNASFAQSAVDQTNWLKESLRRQVHCVQTLVQYHGNDAIDAHRQAILSVTSSAMSLLDLLELYQGAYVALVNKSNNPADRTAVVLNQVVGHLVQRQRQ